MMRTFTVIPSASARATGSTSGGADGSAACILPVTAPGRDADRLLLGDGRVRRRDQACRAHGWVRWEDRIGPGGAIRRAEAAVVGRPDDLKGKEHSSPS